MAQRRERDETRRAWTVGLSWLVAALLGLAAPATARADTVTDWNAHASNALFTVAAQPPPVGVQHMAMVQGAVFDAVNTIDRRYQPYLYSQLRVRPWASRDAAAATAAYRVLVSIVPAQQPALEQLYLASLAGIPGWFGVPSFGISEGIAIGEAAARGDDRRADERRPLRRVLLPDRDAAGPVAPGSARVRERSERLDAEREAVRDPELVAVPLGRAVPAHECRVRGRVQPGQGDRFAEQRDANRCADERVPLLGRPQRQDVEPHRPHAVGTGTG